MKAETVFILAGFELKENLRNKWLYIYAAGFFTLTNLILYTGGGNPIQATASLMSLILLLVPVFSIVFGSLSFTESLSFFEILSTGRLQRNEIYLGKWLGLSTGLAFSYLAGMLLGSILFLDIQASGSSTYIIMLLSGFILTYVFIAMAFLIANIVSKKEVVFGFSLAVWFFLFIVYDLIIFYIVSVFGDYPLEWFIVLMTMLNPIDLARVTITIQSDMSSLMGSNAAVLSRWLGNTAGAFFSLLLLIVLSIIPLLTGMFLFRKRDL